MHHRRRNESGRHRARRSVGVEMIYLPDRYLGLGTYTTAMAPAPNSLSPQHAKIPRPKEHRKTRRIAIAPGTDARIAHIRAAIGVEREAGDRMRIPGIHPQSSW